MLSPVLFSGASLIRPIEFAAYVGSALDSGVRWIVSCRAEEHRYLMDMPLRVHRRLAVIIQDEVGLVDESGLLVSALRDPRAVIFSLAPPAEMAEIAGAMVRGLSLVHDHNALCDMSLRNTPVLSALPVVRLGCGTRVDLSECKALTNTAALACAERVNLSHCAQLTDVSVLGWRPCRQPEPLPSSHRRQRSWPRAHVGLVKLLKPHRCRYAGWGATSHATKLRRRDGLFCPWWCI